MSSSNTETLVEVTMPQLGVSVSEGTVVGWRRQVGETIARDETICEIETDKITTECPSPASGVVSEIVVAAGETVEVGRVLARISSTGGAGEVDWQDLPSSPQATEEAPADGAEDALTPAGSAAVRADGLSVPDAASPDRSEPPGREGGNRHYSPVVMRMVAAHNIDVRELTGTGRGGRVTKKDVEAHMASQSQEHEQDEPPLHGESPYEAARAQALPSLAQAPTTAQPLATEAGAGRGEPLSRMRRSIGEAMSRSLKTAATCTTVVECDMSAIERARRERGLRALPYVARCTVETLSAFPALNATLEDELITRHDRVHLGIAVSLGEEGLIVPVIRDAQNLSVAGLAEQIRQSAERARLGRLTADDVRGATFTITNPGAFGAVLATPVIPLPQVAILDLEAIVRRPVVLVDHDGLESIAIRPIVNLCMSWDHRALDGAYAAQFLTALRGRIERYADAPV